MGGCLGFHAKEDNLSAWDSQEEILKIFENSLA
jgi:hypothetical protein